MKNITKFPLKNKRGAADPQSSAENNPTLGVGFSQTSAKNNLAMFARFSGPQTSAENNSEVASELNSPPADPSSSAKNNTALSAGFTEQSEMPLGPVGAVAGGLVECRCGERIPPEVRICPSCGYERDPYPGADVKRYDWVFELDALDRSAHWTLVALVHHHRSNRKGIFPGQKRLAKMTRQSERTVRDALRRLEAGGWIVRKKRYDRDGNRTSDLYEIQTGGVLLPATTAGSLPATTAG